MGQKTSHLNNVGTLNGIPSAPELNNVAIRKCDRARGEERGVNLNLSPALPYPKDREPGRFGGEGGRTPPRPLSSLRTCHLRWHGSNGVGDSRANSVQLDMRVRERLSKTSHILHSSSSRDSEVADSRFRHSIQLHVSHP